MMAAEIVNLRRARKARLRAEDAAQAKVNRTQHGISKNARDLARARGEKSASDIEGHRLSDTPKGDLS